MKEPKRMARLAEYERFLPGLVEGEPDRCFLYDVFLEGEYTPGGGDDWNEPRYPASMDVMAEIVRVKKWTKDEEELVYDRDFIGPMEPRVQPVGDEFSLSVDELESAQTWFFEYMRDRDEALQEEAWETRRELFRD